MTLSFPLDATAQEDPAAGDAVLLERVAGEIARVAIELRTPEPNSGLDDLEPLRDIVGDARLVSLGEATHGTREFFQLKHRVLEFLVTRMGFTVFAIEGALPEAFDINEYVLTGKGNPRKALSALYFWAWNTEEVLELIEWMRRYNADPAHQEKVKFYGFDMSQPVRAAKVTFDYLRIVDPVFVAEATGDLEILANPITSADFDGLTEERKRAALASAQGIVKRFDERRESYVKRSGLRAWSMSRQHARVLAQNVESRTSDPDRIVRSRSMAENIRWILDEEGPGAKMVAWAHNNHAATDVNTMGSFLRTMLDREMRVIGFAFNEGSFQAIAPGEGLLTFTVPPAPAGSFDAVVASASRPLSLIDLRRIPSEGALAKWLSLPRVTRDIGGVYRESDAKTYLVERKIADRYDALLFVDRTTAARGNPEGRVVSNIPRFPTPRNAGFEESQSDGDPKDWLVLPPMPEKFDFEVTTSDENARTGRRAGVIRRRSGMHYGEAAGLMLQWVDAKAYRDKEVRFRAAVKKSGKTSRVFVWVKVWGAFEERREVTNAEWNEHEIVRTIPASAVVIEYGVALTGEGEAWIDDVTLEIVNPPAPN